MRHLGKKSGKSSQEFVKLLKDGESILEVGKDIYAVSEDSFCLNCDGCGCKSCKFTGYKRQFKMKLNLNKEWYEKRIAAEGDLDVTAGTYL